MASAEDCESGGHQPVFSQMCGSGSVGPAPTVSRSGAGAEPAAEPPVEATPAAEPAAEPAEERAAAEAACRLSSRATGVLRRAIGM